MQEVAGSIPAGSTNSSSYRARDAKRGRMTDRDIERHGAAHLHGTRLEEAAVVRIDADFDATSVEHNHRIGPASADECRGGYDCGRVRRPTRHAIVVPYKARAARALAILQKFAHGIRADEGDALVVR